MDKYRKNKQEKAVSQSHNATSHCQFTYKNINLLSLTVAEKSITKNYSIDCMERKKKEQIYVRTNRTKPVLYPTIQL